MPATWATLLSEGIDAAMANTIADRLLWTGLVETALMGVIFVVLLLTGSRLMVKQVHYLVGGCWSVSPTKDLSHSVLLKSRDEFGDIAKAVAHSQENPRGVFGTQRAACKGAQRDRLPGDSLYGGGERGHQRGVHPD